MNRRRIKRIRIHEKKWVLSLAAALFAMFALYMYFVTASIAQVVARRETERELVDLNARIAALEAEYMNAQYAISEDIASHEGYEPVDDKIFVVRAPTTFVLSLGNTSDSAAQ